MKILFIKKKEEGWKHYIDISHSFYQIVNIMVNWVIADMLADILIKW